MKAIESAMVRGELDIVVYGPDGGIRDERSIDNLVVNSGLSHITSRMISSDAAVMTHLGVGSDETAQAATDVDLGSQIDARSTFDEVLRGGSADQEISYVATFNEGESTGAISEAGIFNGETGGTMLCRTTFPVINKQAEDSMIITWKVILSAE